MEGKGVDASQALAEAMGSIQEAQAANKRIQDTNQAWMLNHTLKPLEVSAWPDDLKKALERGLFCPLKLDDPDHILVVGDIKEKYVPYIKMLRASQNPLLELEAPAPPKGATGPGAGPAHVPARPGL